MKKETLEEDARKYANITHNRQLDEEERYYKDHQKYDGFIKGAKWQQERMYSEEEVLKLLLNIKRVNIYYEDVEKWFQQFKKK